MLFIDIYSKEALKKHIFPTLLQKPWNFSYLQNVI